MLHKHLTPFFVLTTLACSPLILTACQQSRTIRAHQTAHIIVEDGAQISAQHKQKEAKTKHSKHWGYGGAGTVAPKHWGDKEVNKLCKLGQQQSPINIEQVYKKDQAFELKQNFIPQNFTAVNNGHTVVFKANKPKDNTITLNGKVYQLQQFHYHIPSEHMVMNSHYPLEIHFVHQSQTGQLAVIGVLYKIAENNPAFNQLIAELPTRKDKETSLTQFNIKDLMPLNNEVYTYNGSLTTPPCSEQVQWLLKPTAVNIGKTQLQKLNSLYQGNNRPVQPLNGRKVLVY